MSSRNVRKCHRAALSPADSSPFQRSARPPALHALRVVRPSHAWRDTSSRGAWLHLETEIIQRQNLKNYGVGWEALLIWKVFLIFKKRKITVIIMLQRQCNYYVTKYIDGVSRQSHNSFVVSENLRLYVIFLKENKLTSFLEVFAEFSSHREEKSRQF